LFMSAVLLLIGCLDRTPNTYRSAGVGRGTATSTSTLSGTTSGSAGIEGLTPYLLRHSATSILAEEGVPPDGLAEMLGHTNTRMVEQHYKHRITPAIDVDRWRQLRGPVEGDQG